MTVQLDANCLVELATRNTRYSLMLEGWLEDGNSIETSSVAWSEFCNAPLTTESYENTLMTLAGKIIPLDREMAENASRIFNLGGRRRSSHSDCMIAACAILSNTPLSTLNLKDFERFIPHGLRLHSF